ncbi:hypothetical protein BYT27DRAFT_7182341 [Phlegmacium glaucopus]|nr:hypothetical protein BYT27DRAFT_7182341 [Phlegmacium glaucopus]
MQQYLLFAQAASFLVKPRLGGSLALLSHVVFLVFPLRLAHLTRFMRTPRDLLGMSIKTGVFLE